MIENIIGCLACSVNWPESAIKQRHHELLRTPYSLPRIIIIPRIITEYSVFIGIYSGVQIHNTVLCT